MGRHIDGLRIDAVYGAKNALYSVLLKCVDVSKISPAMGAKNFFVSELIASTRISSNYVFFISFHFIVFSLFIL